MIIIAGFQTGTRMKISFNINLFFILLFIFGLSGPISGYNPNFRINVKNMDDKNNS